MLFQWHIIGHEKQLLNLEEEIITDNLSNVYLFSGPPEIGKFTVAKTLAGILECPNNFCRKCPTCIQMEKKSHLDVIEMENDNESIKIEQVREIIGKLNLTGQSKYKIVLLEKIERMTVEAANCLLKTLEEPGPRTIFLLTTDNLPEVIPTIVSRSRIIKFSAFSDTALNNELKKSYPDIAEDKINAAVALASGRAAKAIILMKNPDLLNFYQKIYTTLGDFFSSDDIVKRFQFIDEIVKDKTHLAVFINLFIHLLRKMIIDQIKSADSQPYPASLLISLMEEADRTEELIKRNINAKLALENLMLKF